MGYAFLSYSTKEQQTADSLRVLFNKKGIKTWMAPGDIPFGSTYMKTINRAIKGSSCFVLLLSENSQRSKWVPKETERAVNEGKTIFPISLDDVPLNDDFEFMISTSQAIAIRKIDEQSEEVKKLISAIKLYTDEEDEKANSCNASVVSEPANMSKEKSQEQAVIRPSKAIKLTVWSPVNTDVYLNDKRHLVMKIDHNTGFNYDHSSISVSGEFELIFVSKGFEKIVAFDASLLEDKLEYHLNEILSEKEISASYDRDEAIEQIKEEATAYAYDQLSKVGVAEDIPILLEELNRLSSIKNKDRHTDYLIATCASSLGELAIKFDMIEKVKSIMQVYENYGAKSSYGYMFKPIVNATSNAERLKLQEKSCALNSGSIHIGDYITFGHYKQSDNTPNDKEAIEWRVLDIQDGEALVISKYGLDCKRYAPITELGTWETCGLREYLNHEFLTNAFSAEEIGRIYAQPTSTYDQASFLSAYDKVSLLSTEEAKRYFPSEDERLCQPTSYAKSNGVLTNNAGNCCWWLRSSGSNQNFAAIVLSCGNVLERCYSTVLEHRYGVNTGSVAIRPVMWIKLD